MNSIAWLAIFVWVGVPLFALLMALMLWRWSRTLQGKSIVVIACVAILFAPMLVSSGVKAYYDRHVSELCTKDGGVKVYETVRLPAESFNQWGQPNFYRPDQGEKALGTEYIFKQSISYQHQGSPSLHRYHVQVFSRASGKLLGESIGYSRGGGDLPGPWAPSSFSCPDKYGEIPLLTEIFIKSS
jgi:hypothetical protein